MKQVHTLEDHAWYLWGLQKSENGETNDDDVLNVISARIDENDFRKHLNKIHPIGGAKKTETNWEL